MATHGISWEVIDNDTKRDTLVWWRTIFARREELGIYLLKPDRFKRFKYPLDYPHSICIRFAWKYPKGIEICTKTRRAPVEPYEVEHLKVSHIINGARDKFPPGFCPEKDQVDKGYEEYKKYWFNLRIPMDGFPHQFDYMDILNSYDFKRNLTIYDPWKGMDIPQVFATAGLEYDMIPPLSLSTLESRDDFFNYYIIPGTLAFVYCILVFMGLHRKFGILKKPSLFLKEPIMDM